MAAERSDKTEINDTTVLDTSSTQTRLSRPLDSCVICLDEISERAVAVPCNHCSFDFLCLVSWLEEHRKCPLCNTSLTAVQYDFRSPDDIKTYHLPQLSPPKSPEQQLRINTPNAFDPRARYLTRYDRLHPPQRRQPRRRQAAPRPLDPSFETAIARRRQVYRHQLYCLYVGSNRVSQFRDFTPQTFSKSAELQSRAQKWIRRELQAFEFLAPSEQDSEAIDNRSRRGNHAEFLLSYIISILKSVDVKGSSGKAEELLTDFLGRDNARLFLHELEAWLRSPYTALEDWDRNVQYPVGREMKSQ